MPEVTIKHDLNARAIGFGEDTVEAARQAAAAAASAAVALAAAGPNYADTTAGLAATSDGEAFAVDNGDGTVTVWLNDAGVAVEQRTLPTTAYLASTSGASLIGVLLALPGAVARTVADWFRDRPSIMDFIPAVERVKIRLGTSTTDVAPYVQAAIDTGARELHGPAGNYKVSDLTLDNDYQRLIAYGALFGRMNAGDTLTISGRSVHVYGLRYSGSNLSGDNITVTGPGVELRGVESQDTLGRALYAIDDGGGTLVHGGVYNTLDASATGYCIEFANTVPGDALYTVMDGVETQQNFGGVKISGQGTVRISNCQLGKGTFENGGGGMFTANRFNGAVSVQSPACQFANNSFSASITFGDGVSANIGQITFGDDNEVIAGESVTLNGNVNESEFHFTQFANVTLTIDPDAYCNSIWHHALDVSSLIDITAAGGTPTKGNGTLTAKMSSAGRQRTLRISFQNGGTTDFGSGAYFAFSTPIVSEGIATAPAFLIQGAAYHNWLARMAPGESTIKFIPNVAAGSGSFCTATYPFMLSGGMLIQFSITVEHTP